MLVVLEGIDGSGKGTQTKLLHERALREGLTATHLTFPQYGKNPFALIVSEYLNGAFGGVDDVHPKLSSLLFAGDRFASKTMLCEALESHQLVILDRYIASNLAHQAAKLPEGERDEFIAWLAQIEFGVYGMPTPDLSVFLDVPLDAARQMVHLKARDQQQGSYTQLTEDIHEQDSDYLARCRQVYEQLIHAGGQWVRIDCGAEQGGVRPVHEIGEELWAALVARL